MLPKHFLREPMEGNEVKKFKALLDAFDSAFSYENGFEHPEYDDFMVAYNTLSIQMMEILRWLIARPDFEDIAKRSDEKSKEARK